MDGASTALEAQNGHDDCFLEWLPRLATSNHQQLHRWTGFPELIALSPIEPKQNESSFIAATASTIREGMTNTNPAVSFSFYPQVTRIKANSDEIVYRKQR
jgi:hypothetical protein